ncbi:hypothetical protein [Ligilactobacillus faecis]|nr:hypothetical protein [Ligilactobacillus faecis]WGN90367.1 hypothetical protein QFX10_04720 [Ligilactobacillus faecis]
MKAYALTKKDSRGLEALELIEAPVPRPQADEVLLKLFIQLRSSTISKKT